MKNSCLKFLQADKGKFCQEKFVSIIDIKLYHVTLPRKNESQLFPSECLLGTTFSKV